MSSLPNRLLSRSYLLYNGNSHFAFMVGKWILSQICVGEILKYESDYKSSSIKYLAMIKATTRFFTYTFYIRRCRQRWW